MSLPLTILNSPGISDLADGGSNPEFGTSRDIAGVAIWALGFIIETVADAQKVIRKFYVEDVNLMTRLTVQLQG